jgi:phosphoribosylaminoimidazolecarboxamide formyltransferase/IMP cyclohydrolase
MPTALLSVTDKSGLLELARSLLEKKWSLLASGGTAAHLRKAGLPVDEVADFTGAPEILGGRVKTLHPAIAGGILSRRTEEDRRDLGQGHEIAMVVVNLYRFEETPNVEQIDIGGVTLLRAAAKNYEHVIVVCDVADYPSVLEALPEPTLEKRRALAGKAFLLTARYDLAIAQSFGAGIPLRYGENPHQQASLLTNDGPLDGRLLAGKELSYNNLLDGDVAWRAVESFDSPAVCVVKHASPCGLATAQTAAVALRAALDSDRTSAFGGVIASNRDIDEAFVQALGDLFFEGLLAPGFQPSALPLLSSRKNLRLVEISSPSARNRGEVRSVRGGWLWQDQDQGELDETSWRVVTDRQPTLPELVSLRFAWRAAQHVRSNAIVLARGTQTVGIGGGQPNRIDSLRIALRRAGQQPSGGRAEKPTSQLVLASDGFFPFPDSVELAAQSGITAIVQPGGSLRDRDSINSANDHGITMLLTGRRHFRH